MKKAILLGANGYLGRHIAYFLQQQNIEFVPTDIAEHSVDKYSNYQKIDVTEANDLKRLDFNVDYVFVFAGITGTSNHPDDIEAYTKANVNGLEKIMLSCSQSSARIIFPSTRLVYKGVKDSFLTEDAEKETKTIYAQNKIDCETMLSNSGLNYTIFRICVPYGNLLDSTYSYGTIGFFLNKAIKGNNITIYGDGSQKRTFTHVSDIAKIILETIKHDSTIDNIYNIGSNDSLSLLEVANLVALKYGVEIELIDWPAEALKIESGDTIFDDEKIKKEIAYAYQYSLNEWITEI